MSQDLKAMTDIELSKLAVTLSTWRWCPGMSGTFTLDGELAFFNVFMDHHRARLSVFAPWLSTPQVLPYFLKCYPDARPDLSDPATLGCIRAIIDPSSQRALAEVLVMELSSFDADADEEEETMSRRKSYHFFNYVDAHEEYTLKRARDARVLVLTLSESCASQTSVPAFHSYENPWCTVWCRTDCEDVCESTPSCCEETRRL